MVFWMPSVMGLKVLAETTDLLLEPCIKVELDAEAKLFLIRTDVLAEASNYPI